MLLNRILSGKSLTITAGTESRHFTQDDVLTKQEEEKKAKLIAAKGSGRLGRMFLYFILYVHLFKKD
jgi:hypothetical protein